MLWQPSLPERYTRLSDHDLADAIADRRRRLGHQLVILGHHYQTDEVIRHADFTGDSLKLSQLAGSVARQRDVRWVVFCGVHFMAESADMLTPEHVQVILPDLSAGCSMADMADIDDTIAAWDTISGSLARAGWTGRIVPITYVNSTAAIKAYVGDRDGACCTSSNADRVFEWAISQGDDVKILFLPDQHLGRNTAARFGIDVTRQTCVYDPKLARQGEPFGGATEVELLRSRVILWAGHCSVHKLFRPEHCHRVRQANQSLQHGQQPMRILVHPECAKEVVDLADLSGSTEYIINTIRQSPPGSRWAVGTEHHLVDRLRQESQTRGVEVRILSDCQCMCTTMYRIDQPHLLWVLDGLCGVGTGPNGADGPPVARNVISVPTDVRNAALRALSRMLELTTLQPVD
ncbi:MAG: quinolinate synthase NadA [Phycisphaerales bacterium]|nr:quinolinate synthase NadA [Phycisphaerales bacterium]